MTEGPMKRVLIEFFVCGSRKGTAEFRIEIREYICLMQSAFFLGNSWHSCKVEYAGDVNLSAGLYTLEASDLCSCLFLL